MCSGSSAAGGDGFADPAQSGTGKHGDSRGAEGAASGGQALLEDRIDALGDYLTAGVSFALGRDPELIRWSRRMCGWRMAGRSAHHLVL